MYTFVPVFIYLFIYWLIYLFNYIFTYCLINHLYLYYPLKYWIIYINFQFSDVESIETSLEEKESEIDSDSPDIGFALDPNGQVCSVSFQEKISCCIFFQRFSREIIFNTVITSYLRIYLFIYLLIYLFICLFICLFIYLFIYLFI